MNYFHPFLLLLLILAPVATLIYYEGTDKIQAEGVTDMTGKNNGGEKVEVTEGNLELTLAIPEKVQAGTPVTVSFTLSNMGEEPESFSLPYLGFRFDFAIYENGQLVYQWSKNRVFAEAIDHVTIPPGESLMETLSSSPQTLPSGTYTVVGTFKGSAMEASIDFTVTGSSLDVKSVQVRDVILINVKADESKVNEIGSLEVSLIGSKIMAYKGAEAWDGQITSDDTVLFSHDDSNPEKVYFLIKVDDWTIKPIIKWSAYDFEGKQIQNGSIIQAQDR